MLYGFASEKNGINAFLLEITTIGDVSDLMIIPVFSICVLECLLTVCVVLFCKSFGLVVDSVCFLSMDSSLNSCLHYNSCSLYSDVGSIEYVQVVCLSLWNPLSSSHFCHLSCSSLFG